MAKGQPKDDRTMNWTCLLYPESVIENWKEELAELQVRLAVSPIHDKDFNADGTAKKPHYHVAFAFDGNKSYEQVHGITESFKGTVPQRCKSLKATVRYMTHMDNPEKAQYARGDITTFGGFDIDAMFLPTVSERYEVLRNIIEFIDNNDVIEFCDLVRYASAKQYDTWFPILADSAAYFIGQYIKSARGKVKDARSNKYTGEIISPP